MPKKISTQELEGTRRRRRPRNGWKEEVERDLQVLGVRQWRKLVMDRKKNGRILFNRPKPTVGCSTNGRRRNNVINEELPCEYGNELSSGSSKSVQLDGLQSDLSELIHNLHVA